MDIFEKLRTMWAKPAKAVEPFSDLELALGASLVPVAPRAEFVEQLRTRLEKLRPAPIPQRQPRTAQTERVLLGAAGAASLSLALFASVRMALAIIISIGLLFQFGQQARQRRQETA